MTTSFDEFSILLAEEQVPRRESLRRLGAIIAGAMLGPFALGVDPASAKPRQGPLFPFKPRAAPKKPAVDPCQAFCKRCTNKQKQTQCLTACRACNGDTSRLCGSCGSYTCVDFSSDQNCGACGNDCSVFGQTCCGGYCADLKSDPENCGACGKQCGGLIPHCVNGVCSSCPAGQAKCGDSCVYLYSDPTNCGACGNVCPAGTECSSGMCIPLSEECPYGSARCGGVCTDILFDALNCGACGNQCAPLDYCDWGTCAGVCIGCE